MGVLGLRAWSPEALERRVAASRPPGSARAGPTATSAAAPSYRFRDPDGHVFELYYECERYVAPAAPDARATRTSPAATPAAAARSSASTTSTSSPPTCAPTASSASTRSATGSTSASSSTTAREAGAWMSATIAAHELIYTRDAYGAPRPAAPRRVLGRHARGVPARRRHLARRRASRSRPRRPSTRSPRASSSTASSPAATASRSPPAGASSTRPTSRCVVWTEAERTKGQAWGVKTVESFHTYGTPPVEPPG